MSGESGGGFESRHQPRVDTPERMFRQELRQMVSHILEDASDPFSVEIATKIQEKLDIKDRIDELQSGRNDISHYQDWKYLGIFIVIDRESRIDYYDEEHDIDIRKGDRILDIHLPNLTDEQRQNLFHHIDHSMRMIADYIVTQHLHPKYILGVTFEKLARVSKRQGFTVVEPEVPDDIRRGIERVYDRFASAGIDEPSMGRALLCIQETGKFVQRYATTKE